MQKKELRPIISHHTQKLIQMDQRPKCMDWNYKSSNRQYRIKYL